MSQTQARVTIDDVGFNPTGELYCKVSVNFNPFGFEKKRKTVTGFINLSEWIKDD